MHQRLAVTFLRPTETTLFILVRTQSFSGIRVPFLALRMGPENGNLLPRHPRGQRRSLVLDRYRRSLPSLLASSAAGRRL
jgi:hypothetical protein